MRKFLRKVLLKLLGIDTNLKQYRATLDAMQVELSQLHECYAAIQVHVAEDIWEETEKNRERRFMYMDNPQLYRMYREALKAARRDWVIARSALKIHRVMHRGCHGCVTPLENSIGHCLGCQYMVGINSGYPDLSKCVSSEEFNKLKKAGDDYRPNA